MFKTLQQYLKTGFLSLFLLFILSPQKVEAQYPTITVKYDTFHLCPGTVIVSLIVAHADSVTSISILSSYNSTVFTPCTPCISPTNPLHPTVFWVNPKFLSSYTINCCCGNINVGWFGLLPTNFGNDTLVKFKFNFLGGATNLVFDSAQCSFTGPPLPNGSDTFIPTIYKNGRVDNLGYEALIIVQPPDDIICEYSDAFYPITAQYATGYHWQVSTDGGLTFTPLVNVGVYSGVSTNWLTLTNPPLSFSGYKFRCLVDGICINKMSTVKSLSITPHNTPYVGPNDTICAGDPFYLTATAVNVTSKVWTKSGTGTIDIVPPLDSLHIKYTPSAADIAAGQVVLTLTVGGSYPCITVHSEMTLFIMPIPIASAGPPTGGCAGDSILLTATGGLNYDWSSGQHTASIKVAPAVTSTYSVTVSSYGCSSTSSVLVTVVAAPSVTASVDGTICAGSTFQPSVTGTNNSSFLWTTSGAGSFSSTIVQNPVYTPDTADINAGFVWLYVQGKPNPPCAVSSIDSVLLTIKPYPNASAGPDVSVCLGEPATLTASGGGTYQWNSGPTTASITVSPGLTTNYYVTVSDQGCSKVDTATVIIKPLPLAYAGADTIICHGSSATLRATEGVGYEWSTGAFAPIIIVSPIVTTIYTVTVTGSNNCTATDNVTVIINTNLQVSVDPSNPFMCQDDMVNLHATSTHPCAFSWTPATFLNTTSGPDVISNSPYSITYTVQGIDALGCIATAQAVVTVFERPLVRVLPWSVTLCKGEVVNLSATGALTYFWEPPTGLSSNSNPNVIAAPKESTTYKVTGTDINGCKAMDSVVIEVNPVPFVNLPNALVVCNGTNFLLDAGTALDQSNYLWQNGTTSSWQYASTPGIYWVQVERKGCMVWDSTIILPCSELFIPNAFTPDGDGLNDEFKVISSGDVLQFHMYIYNRWGEVVFETINIDQGWDGRKKGDMCPVGVYSYMIEYLGQGNVLLEKEGKRYGSVLLLR